jgi:uncharacterized cupin superfamily protein
VSERSADALTSILTQDLEDTGPPRVVLDGQPVTFCRVLYEDAGMEVGIWSVTPGVFASVKQGLTETMHFRAGAGHITHPDGSSTVIAPDTLLHLHDGWQGTWHVTETVRKSYVIVQTRPVAEVEDSA